MTDTPAKLPALSVKNAENFAIVINDSEGCLCKLGYDGTLQYSERYVPDVAAKTFWEALARFMPAAVIPRQPDAGATRGFNELLGAVQKNLLAMGLDAPRWEDTIRDLGDYDAALESCTKTMAKLLRALSAPDGSRGWMPADPECERVKWIDPAGYDFIGIVIQDRENAFKLKRYVLPLPTAPEDSHE